MLTDRETADCFTCWNQLLCLTDDLDDLETPKRHAMAHLLKDMASMGNPTRYANWLDESYNRMLKNCCRTVSQATFESFLLVRMSYLLSHERSGLKRKA